MNYQIRQHNRERDIIINCSYKLVDGDWETVSLNFDEFYEDHMVDGERIFDLTPKYFLEPRDYLEYDREKIKYLKFFISDGKGNEIHENYSYWLNGVNQIKEYSEIQNGTVIYRTIIQSIEIENNMSLLLRFEEFEGVLNPMTNLLMNSETDEIIEDLNITHDKL